MSQGEKDMGCACKVQKIQREKQSSYYVNLPTAIAEALEIEKGEIFEWYVEDRNTLVLQRHKPRKPKPLKNIPLS
jgi:bifunctional DNA-binding transcriptional regulator/antitoxin component of YhaV-PrlF toxin-antitoxin module